MQIMQQVNNIKITWDTESKLYVCVAPDGRHLQEFSRWTEAQKWCVSTHDFLSPTAMCRQIAGAWKALRYILSLPKLEQREIVFEHGEWFVVGYDTEDQRREFVVAPAIGLHSFNGMSFEEL